MSFCYRDSYKINILGSFNVYNALPAIIIGSFFGISHNKIQEGLKNLKVIPGRMEKIDEGQNFLVFVDYAHEKEGMNAVLDTAKDLVRTAAESLFFWAPKAEEEIKQKGPF